MDKKNLRRIALTKRENCNYTEKDKKITQIFLKSSDYKNAKSIFIYNSSENEIDTREIIKKAFSDKKTVYIPKIISKGVMKLSKINEKTVLTQNLLGIFESEKFTERAAPDIAVVPCLMADEKGFRLGYGGGFYDIYLSKFKGKSICLCYSDDVVKSLPIEDFDIRCDKIITEEGEININEK